MTWGIKEWTEIIIVRIRIWDISKCQECTIVLKEILKIKQSVEMHLALTKTIETKPFPIIFTLKGQQIWEINMWVGCSTLQIEITETRESVETITAQTKILDIMELEVEPSKVQAKNSEINIYLVHTLVPIETSKIRQSVVTSLPQTGISETKLSQVKYWVMKKTTVTTVLERTLSVLM